MITPNVTARLRLLHAATMALAIALTGCDAKDEPMPPADDATGEAAKTYLSMLLNTGSDRPASRADSATGWYDPFDTESGNDIENRIDPKKINIAIYKADGTPLGTITSTGNSNGVKIYRFVNNPKLYQVVFDASGLGVMRGEEYIAAVTVNADGSFNADDIDHYTFSAASLTGVTNPADGPNYYSRGVLPMFGFIRWRVGSTGTLGGQLDGFPSIGTINLLRSVTKIEIAITQNYDQFPDARYMTFDTSNPPRLGYAGHHTNSLGYTAPRMRNWINKSGTNELSFAESFHENSSTRLASKTDNIYFHATSADGLMYYIYLPEASAESMRPNEEPLRLNVSIDFNKPATGNDPAIRKNITGTLFPSLPYDDKTGRPQAGTDYNSWRLMRNHIYRFTLTDFVDETSLGYIVTETRPQINFVPDFE